MKTTQIILEHLISGIQGIVWITLVGLSILGLDVLSYKLIGVYENLVLALLVALVYPLGIIIDNISDELLKSSEDAIRSRVPGGNQSMRYLLTYHKDLNMEEFFDYIRMRIRICRSTFFNLFCITISLVVFTIVRWNSLELKASMGQVLTTELVIGLSLVLMAYYSWYLLTISFAKKIAKRYEEIGKAKPVK